jgi:hypothetical protein
LLAGLVSSSGSIVVALFGPRFDGWVEILVAQPAPWTVPLAFATMVAVSLRGRPPAWSRAAMLRLHLDERHLFGNGGHVSSDVSSYGPDAAQVVHSSPIARRSYAVRRIGRRLNH